MHNCNWKLEFQGKDVVAMGFAKRTKEYGYRRIEVSLEQ